MRTMCSTICFTQDFCGLWLLFVLFCDEFWLVEIADFDASGGEAVEIRSRNEEFTGLIVFRVEPWTLKYMICVNFELFDAKIVELGKKKLKEVKENHELKLLKTV